MNKISLFKSGILQTVPNSNITIAQVVNYIKNDKTLIKKTAQLREQDREKASREQIKKSLPYVTFSGTFTSRKVKGLLNHSWLLAIDLDHIGNIDDIRTIQNKIKDRYTPSLMFVSPSGDGLKIVFSIDVSQGTHIEYFTAVRGFFEKHFQLAIDEACKDISRACFLCHDPQAVYSERPDVLDRNFIMKETPQINTAAPAAITHADVDENTSYNAAKSWVDKKVIFKEGNRNAYITNLADALNRFGISLKFALNKLKEFQRPGFTTEEIERTVRSRYQYTEWHGTANENNDSSPASETKKIPYIRVGCIYYKIILKRDRNNIEHKTLKVWKKEEIIQDHKRPFLKTIPIFDDFIMIPDNLNYRDSINNCYNLYSEFPHIPQPGPWPWTEILLRHVFGPQFDLGIRYMQILYLYPKKSTIILVLVSEKRQTGKTTFLNWIQMLFGDNVALISSSDFQSGFNGHYATKNIIEIEETMFDKKITMEKLKALSTHKRLPINEKFVAPYYIDFYGKIIMASNNEDRFAQVEDEEIRFFVQTLHTPEFTNHSIEDDLLKEIPAFLDHLRSLPPVDWSISRSGFTPDELNNPSLRAVKEESKSGLYKDLKIYIADFFDNNNLESFKATPIDIWKKFYPHDNRMQLNYIKRILKKELKLEPSLDSIRYVPFEDPLDISKTGRPYIFLRSNFTNVTKEESAFLKYEISPF